MAAKFNLLIAAKTSGSAAIKRMGNSMQGLQGKLKNVGLSLRGVNRGFAALGLAVSGGAFAGMVKGAIDSADSFGKMSDQTGIAANKLQAYVNAGKLAGVEQATIDKGLRRLAQSMREANQGVATYSDSYEALGISVTKSDGSLKASETVLGEIADRFKEMPDGATKAAIAMEIFGRSGANLINLLNGGKVALEEFNYETSQNFAQNAEFFNDQIAVLAIRFDGFRKQLADALLPTLNNLIAVFSDLFKSENDWQALFKVIEGGLKVISATVFSLIAAFRFLSRTITDIFRILGKASKFDFSGAGDIAKAGLSDTQNQFKKDMETFKEIFTGTEETPESYFAKGTKEAAKLKTEIGEAFGSQMQSKLKTFRDSIKSVGQSMSDLVIKGIKGMEDALVNFVTGGKLNFRDLANSIIKDMIRIQIQQSITKPLSNFFSSLFTKNANGNVYGQNGIVPFANGGIVTKPTVFPFKNGIGLMGEAGAEAILPLTRRNGKLGVEGGGNNTVVNVSVDASGTEVQGDEQQGRALGQLIAAAVQSELVQQSRPGGILNPA